MGGFSKSWCHMLNGYPAYIRDAGIQDVWKTAPAAFETCWDMRKWVSEGWSLRYIFNYALAGHASIINNKSAPLPPGANVRGEIERFLRRLGYRLVLREFQNSPTAKPGQKLELAMKWQNVGSAPCYKPYRLAYRLSRTDGYGKVFISPVAVNRWLPGSIEMFMPDFFKQPGDLPPGPLVSVSDSISMPADVPAGRYTLSIAVVDAASSSPIIKLSIKGRAPDGWYPISNVEIVR